MAAKLAKIRLPGGAIYEIPFGTPFSEAVRAAARSQGISHFRVFLSANSGPEREIQIKDAPPIIEPEHEVRIEKFDVAG